MASPSADTTTTTNFPQTETLTPLPSPIQSSTPQSPITEPPQEEPQTVSKPPTETQTQTTDHDAKRKREEPEEEEEEETDAQRNAKRALHPMWKTSLCSYFRSYNASCSHGENCKYAHGEDELRIRPDGTWDPTSVRAKKLLEVENLEKNGKEEEDVMMTDAALDSQNLSLDKCLVHLPQKWYSDNLKRYLNEQGVLFKTAKKKKGMTVGFVSFETADQVKDAIKGLDGKSLLNKLIKIVDIIPRPFEKKNQSTYSFEQSTKHVKEKFSASEDPNDSTSLDDSRNDEGIDKNDSKVDGSISKVRCARDAVSPLANMPYNSQLEHKKSSLQQILKRLTRNARKACPSGVPVPEWIVKSRQIGGLPCKLEGILESPLVNGYRNKCEFSVGYSLQGKPTVGFMLGNFREGVTAVEEPTDCPNVSRIACKFASIFQEFLQHSGLPLWNRLNNTGFWRQLTVREGRNPGQAVGLENLEANVSEVMLIVQISSSGFDDELIKCEFQSLAQAFAHGATASSPHLPLTSLVVQDHTGISNAAPADAPLQSLSIPGRESASGKETADKATETRIHDYISNLRFSISPTAFFQVNTLAAEKLYSLAGDWAGLGPDTLLFDICCGTGTIGLTLAHRVGMVVGIEMNASAVSDAHRNAEINGIKNCKFICSKAEDVIGSLLNEYLNVPNKQKETPHASESNGNGESDDKENSVSDDKQNDSLTNADTDKNDPSTCPQNVGEKLETTSQACFPKEENGRSEFSAAQYRNVVAIVDPPRVGLHHIVIKALRTHPRLRRLVYISCNPESLVANAIELCTPSSDKDKGNKDNGAWRNQTAASVARRRAKSMPCSEPFRPVKAMAVDLFPHTPHCEMVMLLER